MDIEGMILNGYLRLYCAIVGLPLPPKRCRVCGGEVDLKWKARKAGCICLDCYREYTRRGANKYRHKYPERANARSRKYALANGYKIKARSIAHWVYKKRQVCQVPGCQGLGVRHHPDYNKPKEIQWLCDLHHRRLGGLTLSV